MLALMRFVLVVEGSFDQHTVLVVFYFADIIIFSFSLFLSPFLRKKKNPKAGKSGRVYSTVCAKEELHQCFLRTFWLVPANRLLYPRACRPAVCWIKRELSRKKCCMHRLLSAGASTVLRLCAAFWQTQPNQLFQWRVFHAETDEARPQVTVWRLHTDFQNLRPPASPPASSIVSKS